MAALNDILVNSKEAVLDCLGNSTVVNLLANGMLTSKYMVLSQKRIYYKGKSFLGFLKFEEEKIVDIEDVTGSGFIEVKPSWMILVIALFMILIAGGMAASMTYVTAIGIIGAVLFIILYFLNRRLLFVVFYSGGSMTADMKFVSKERAVQFNKTLRMQKEIMDKGRKL